MDDYRIYRQILCIDLKGFFASVECALRGLDPYKTPLIVADKGRGGGSVVLAITPYLKARGMKTRCRLHDIDNLSELIIAKPRMREYLHASKEVIKIYLSYVSHEDLHIYSIDEAFLDLTHYMRLYNTDIKTIAKRILTEILDTLNLPATCGIGDNLLLSKLALDLYSKSKEDNIAQMRYEDVPSMLWGVKPLSEMWGIGPRMERRLNQLNIYSVGALAHAKKATLKRLFGIMGEELYYHAHGIDMSIISDKHKDQARIPMKSVGLGQTLFKDYDRTMIMQIFIEMSDEVAEKLRFVRQAAKTIHLGVGYSKAYGGGFSRQLSLEHATNDNDAILEAVLSLYLKHSEALPIRKVSIRATNLEAMRFDLQVSFFEDVLKKERRTKLWQTIDTVRQRFGKASVARLSSYLDEGTFIERTGFVGGHNA